MENAAVIIARLTEGLRTLPTDIAARVRHFLVEYLGEAGHQVPFGGRERDFMCLDAWLDDPQAPPYALLAAPAGRGKSALLLRWCQRLLALPEVAVVYFPVSIRFRTNLAGVTFPALVALLANVHGEQIPTDPNLSTQIWYGLLLTYINRPLPDGRRLLLVLDGVDEAADWDVSRLFASELPPAGGRVILAARSLASDQDASAWLERLGWTQPGRARTFELYPLERTGIASVLLQMGFPLDTLGTRVDMVTELHRLSEGDPLLLRLYVDDLWERGEQATRLQPGDLLAIHPGLAGYLERWWNEQRLLWGQEAPTREAALHTLLSLLAGALGPLSREDLCELAPVETGKDSQQVEQQIRPLARFIIGDGQQQGYVFSHPRLASYFLEERLSQEERLEVEARFLAWGNRVLHAVHTGQLAPFRASSYIVQYYGVHLEHAQAGVETLRMLVCDGWRRAWEKLDRANAGFLGDSERAWQAARQANQAAVDAGESAPYLDVEVRSLLCRLSMNSMISNISPRLMCEAVRTGLWTPAQGLASVRLLTDLASRARTLVMLAPLVHEPLRTAIQQEALDIVFSLKDISARLDLLVELAHHLPEHMLLQIIDVVPTISDEADRAGLLVELAPTVAPYPTLLAQVLHVAQEIEDEEYIALALAGLAPTLDTEQRMQVWQLVKHMQDERYRCQVLLALLPGLPEPILQEIAQDDQLPHDMLSRLRLLTTLAKHVAIASQGAIVSAALALLQQIDDLDYRVEIQLRLAPWLDKATLGQALADVRSLWDEQLRARTLLELLPFLADVQIADALTVACTLRNEEYRSSVLLQLLPRLTSRQLEEVLKMVQTIWDEGCRALLLAQLAHCLPAGLRPALLDLIDDLQDPGYSIWVLAEIETSEVGAGSPVATLIAQKLLHMSDQQERLQALLAVVDRLSNEALDLVFNMMLPQLSQLYWYTANLDQRIDLLCKLAPRVPTFWLPTGLRLIQALGDESYQTRILLAFEPRMNEIPLADVLDIVRTMQDWRKRAQVLEILITALPDRDRGERVREMIQALQILKDDAERVHVLGVLAPCLPKPFPTEHIQPILANLRTMPAEISHIQILQTLVPHLPEQLLLNVLNDVSQFQQIQYEEAKVAVLKTIATVLPAQHMPALLEIAQQLRNEQRRSELLSCISASLPQAAVPDMLNIAAGLSRSQERSQVLNVLATHWPEAIFARQREIFAQLHHSHVASLLAVLAAHLPATYVARLLPTIEAIPEEKDQRLILRALARHMQPGQASEALDSVLQTKQETWRVLLCQSLIPVLPADDFPRLLQASQKLHSQVAYLSLLDTLIYHVPEASFLNVLQLVQDIEDEQQRRAKLIQLLMRTPEHAFLQCWQVALDEKDARLQQTLFIVLAKCVPEQYFSRLWETFSSDYPRILFQEKMVENLADRVPATHLAAFWEHIARLPRVHQERFWSVLLPHLAASTPNLLFNDLLLNEIRKHLPTGKLSLSLLTLALPRLSEEQALTLFRELFEGEGEAKLEEIFATTRKTWHAKPWEHVLAALLPRLPADALQTVIPALLRMLQQSPGLATHADLLLRVAEHVPPAALPLLLQTIWLLDKPKERELVLTRIFPTLTSAGWLSVFTFLDEHTQDRDQLHALIFTLHAAVSSGQAIPKTYLLSRFHHILARLTTLTRREALGELGLCAPILEQLGGKAAVAGVYISLLEIGTWWP